MTFVASKEPNSERLTDRRRNLRIGFLHTIKANQVLFSDAADEMGLSSENLQHQLRSDLREAVEKNGKLTEGVRSQAIECLETLAKHCDAVILTCATLGAAADALDGAPVPIVRADVALANFAAEKGKRISVLCAAESALANIHEIFAKATGIGDVPPKVIHVPDAWRLFKAGDLKACLVGVAASADAEFHAGADVVALGHPWMTGAKEHTSASRRPLDIPSAAVRVAIRRALDRSGS